MSKTNDTANLEYYKAKQDAGQLPVIKQETTKPSKPVKINSDGYVPMNEVPEKEREFERYKEFSFAQKASDKAKRNPMIP